MSDISQNLHRDIMRSVKVVKRRYYLFGLLSGFFVSFLVLLYIVYLNMIEEESFDFINVLIDSLRTDTSLIFEFKEDLKDFLPLTDLGWSLLLFLVVMILGGIVFRYRKALFLKVGKFDK